MVFEILETERLILKKITPEMFAQLFATETEAHIKKLLGLHSDAEFTKEKHKSQGGYTTYDRTIVAFLLVRKDNGQTIGRCGFHNWYIDHRKAEIGYALNDDDHKQKGYMTECLKPIIDYGFDVMDLNRIEACIGLSNTASQKLVNKYGFVQEGLLRQHYIKDNDIQDSLIFSLLKHEYKSKG